MEGSAARREEAWVSRSLPEGWSERGAEAGCAQVLDVMVNSRAAVMLENVCVIWRSCRFCQRIARCRAEHIPRRPDSRGLTGVFALHEPMVGGIVCQSRRPGPRQPGRGPTS